MFFWRIGGKQPRARRPGRRPEISPCPEEELMEHPPDSPGKWPERRTRNKNNDGSSWDDVFGYVFDGDGHPFS